MDSHDRNRYDDDLNNGGTVHRHADGTVHSHAHGTEPHAHSAGTMNVRRNRGGLGWLLPLLLLALVVGAAAWMMNRDDDPNRTVDRDATVGTSGTNAASTAAALGALEPGSDVNLTRVRITDVVGDRTFWVGDGDNRALVIIPEDRTAQTGRESRERFMKGQEVSVAGRVAQNGAPEGLDEKDREAVSDADGRVIVARTVRIREQ